MKITIGAWYAEPNVSFDFSHRVSNFIRDAITECIIAPMKLSEKDKNKFLHLTIYTKSNQNKLEVKLIPIKKDGIETDIDCEIWLPYKAIITSARPLEKYVNFHIKSLPLIFEKWNVTEKSIKNAGDKIRNEIFGNPLYELTKEEKENLEEDKNTLSDILNELGLE